MIYVTSDIHGEYDRYLRLLEAIDFSSRDHLYVIGDIIDRGEHGVDVAFDMLARENVTLLKGNHEVMALATLGLNPQFGAKDLWFGNGGRPTFYDLRFHRSRTERNEILDYFEDAPVELELEVGGRCFHLVHGFPGETEQDKIWGRPNADSTSPWPDKTVIVGHTPTPFIDPEYEIPHARIWYGNGIIDIDCGCGHKPSTRRLACLRLDDMVEFYV